MNLQEYYSRQEWIAATLGSCLAGDRVRVPGEEAVCSFSSAGEWHADNTDPYLPKRWDHQELVLDLSVNPGRRNYPVDHPCEILCTPERAAVLLLQRELGAAPLSVDE